MKRYEVVKDLQGGAFGMGRQYTAPEWLEQVLDWRDADGWSEDARADAIQYWKQALAEGREQELIDYIAEIWELELREVK